ncbi:MAG TPA: nucleotidyltransferase domain-containing protein [Candidatus Thermoplasmatota archaeon]|nr:nucleotidyltransferase domain-containing protein [Candidatus Thermoplasmatota archaeon]
MNGKPPTDLTELREIARKAAIASGAKRVILFGSVARGESREDSDLDLLLIIDTEDQHELLRAAERAELAFWPRDFAMDLVPMRLSHYESGASVLAREAQAEGIELHAA